MFDNNKENKITQNEIKKEVNMEKQMIEAISLNSREETIELSKKEMLQESEKVAKQVGAIKKKEFIAMADKPYSFLVEGLLPMNSPTVLYASAGTGKSLLGLQLCQCIISGKDFLGHKVMNLPNAKCFYFSLEDGEYDVAHRLEKQDKFLCTNEESDDNMWGICEYKTSVLETLEVLLDAFYYAPPVLIVIDTLSDVMKGDMNSMGEVKGLYREFKDVVNKYSYQAPDGNYYHPHLMFIHHTGKHADTLAPNKKNALGSTGIFAGARTAIELKASAKDPSLLYACITKSNCFETDGMGIEMKRNEFLCFEPTGRKVAFENIVYSSDNSANEEKFLEIDKMHNEDHKTWEEIGEYLGLHKDTVRKFYYKQSKIISNSDEQTKK